jgi:DNA polymerase-3 subunit epsilon
VTTTAIVLKCPFSPAPAVEAPPTLRPIVFLDLETTGLDPQRDSIIEVAAMRVDPTSFAIEGWFETKIAVPAGVDVDPRAAELNGFRSEDWPDAPELADVLELLARFLEGCLIAGHNPAFDWAFLSAAFRRLGVRRPNVGHHLLDTASLAWPLLRLGFVRSLALRDICEHYGISNRGEHHAMADVVRTYRVFLRLLHAPGNADVFGGRSVQ